ncbi:hypothetical protein [Rhodococcus sp. NPDC127528]|uniref:hypothetical protein n=1 Tax=unclassified Rhodococcus (in: high G+C Gram-positive bacteria) TaxID=192944 RepID=UPI00362B9428
MGGTLVLTIDFADGSVSAGLLDTGTGLAQRLSLGEPDARSRPELVVPAATSAAAVASAQLAGIIAGPDALVLTHPADWTRGQVGGLRDAATAAGYQPNQVTVRPAGRG